MTRFIIIIIIIPVSFHDVILRSNPTFKIDCFKLPYRYFFKLPYRYFSSNILRLVQLLRCLN